VAKPVVQRPRADADIDEIHAFLRRESAAAAARFLDSVEAAYRLLSEYPAVGSARHAEYCPELPYPLRFHALTGFPRILVYDMDRPDAVEIIRIWHAARGLEALLDDIAIP
jgi:toxin ParE1/3/4